MERNGDKKALYIGKVVDRSTFQVLAPYDDEMTVEQRKANLAGEDLSAGSESWFQNRFTKELQDLASVALWRGVLAEFVGTLILCLWTIGFGLYREGNDPLSLFSAAVGTGLLVAGIIATLLNASGGHINPAVSLGFLLCKQITVVRFVFFSAAQFASGLAAVGLIKTLFPVSMHGSLGYIGPAPDVTSTQVLLAEFLVGYLLLFGIAGLIDNGRKDVTGLVPMYVGFMVAANILFAGRLSGGCMNPARNLGPAIFSGNTDLLWAYMIGPLLGAACGTLTFNVLLSESGITAACRNKGTSVTRRESDGSGADENMI